MSALLDSVRDLLAATAAAAPGAAAEVKAIGARLDEPLRVAIAGRVKAGKSTLLNALIGDELAPTYAGECTRIVTWYRHGHTYRATLHLPDGTTRQTSFTRQGGPIEVDLAGLDPGDIDHIVIEWPTPRLEHMTLIDTPGIASASTEVSERTHRFFEASPDGSGAADAVLYLMRHLHSSDIDFLEAFHDGTVASTPVNAIGLLSRADEIGVGRLDAMRSANTIAARYRSDPKLRGLCQTVIAVNALLGETGATLTQDEYAALTRLAEAPRGETDALLLSADRFCADGVAAGLSGVERTHLLMRLGMFGVRVSIAALRMGSTPTAGKLAQSLVKKSGVDEVRHELFGQFAARSDSLRARSALAALETVLSGHGGDPRLWGELERIRSSAHEFAEMAVFNAHRAGAVDFGKDRPLVDRLLSAGEPRQRLGLDDAASPDQVRSAALGTIEHFRRRAENPLSSRGLSEAAHVLVRTCEGMMEAAR
ncbi:MAG: dynamin family protein [Acidimicrobiia bacterium]